MLSWGAGGVRYVLSLDGKDWCLVMKAVAIGGEGWEWIFHIMRTMVYNNP